MAWRPYDNLIDGELDNRTQGKVTGWIRFFRTGKAPLKVTFDLEGDFHEDIRGAKIRLTNPNPSDRHIDGPTYMDGFDSVQKGTVGDMTAGRPVGVWNEKLAARLMAQHERAWDENRVHGLEREERRRKIMATYREHIAAGELYYAYVPYPYIEWYASNGRVVLELDPSQVEIVETAPAKEKTGEELYEDDKKRMKAFGSFMNGMVESFSKENRKKGGDGNVTGIVVG